MQNKWARFLVTGATSAFYAFTIGCSGDTGFTGSEESGGKNSLSIEDGVVTETFEATGKANEDLDVVWTIDNSGSMKEEAEHVRANFAKFIDYVGGRSNLKLALISYREDQDKHGVTLAEAQSSENFLQIPKEVDSNEGLEMVLDHLDSDLDNFLRPTAEKAFIFVTDDESKRQVSAEDFSNAIKAKYPGQNFTAHSFVSLGDAKSPCAAKEGQQYQMLSLASGGKSFNICDANWEQHFETLAKAVAGQVQSKFQLASSVPAGDILSVNVNDQVIDSASYSVDGQTLSISPRVMNSTGTNTISIQYNQQ